MSLVRDKRVLTHNNNSNICLCADVSASKKMINAAESKKNTKPLSLEMSSDEDLLLLFTK